MVNPDRRWIVGCGVLAFLGAATPPTAWCFPPGGLGTLDKAPEPKVFGFAMAPDAPTRYVVDGKSYRNEVVFTSKAPKETIKGKAQAVHGELSLNPRTFAGLSGTFEVEWKDLDTGNPTRNEHMISPPWVNAQEHPKIVFKLTGVEFKDKQSKSGKTLRGKLAGEMSMNGKSKSLTIPATFAYVGGEKGKKGKPVKEGLGIKASFSVNLDDFDIQGKGVGQAVAKTQKINVRLFLARQMDEEKTATDAKKTKGKKKKKKDDSPAT